MHFFKKTLKNHAFINAFSNKKSFQTYTHEQFLKEKTKFFVNTLSFGNL